ncbi:MAG: hypothetical protein EA399_02220, partial [Desulfovibrionales bacterium]
MACRHENVVHQSFPFLFLHFFATRSSTGLFVFKTNLFSNNRELEIGIDFDVFWPSQGVFPGHFFPCKLAMMTIFPKKS